MMTAGGYSYSLCVWGCCCYLCCQASLCSLCKHYAKLFFMKSAFQAIPAQSRHWFLGKEALVCFTALGVQ